MATGLTGRVLHTALYGCIAVLAACATSEQRPPRFCESSLLLVDAQFEGGNFHRCSISGRNNVRIEIRPEDAPPINRSPWYAFRLSGREPGNVTVDISFTDGYARYWPKFSHDGTSWTRMPDDAVQLAADGESMSLSVPLEQTPVWIAAQELLLPQWYGAWMQQLSGHAELTLSTLGHSALGRPIEVAMSYARPEAVFLIGRQHPPEVTGAFAMRSFVDTVMADSELAIAFRKRFQLVIIPLLNPDGVVLGHWRHNINGVDLNRDWGPFTQPETRGVAELLQTMDDMHIEPKLMLDFHSTRESLFYTQMPDDFALHPDEAGARRQDFATVWLTRSRERLPDFEFKHDPRPPSGQENTKNYFFSRYGIPAITYEIGDEVARDDIAASTPVFAEEMMRLMLER